MIINFSELILKPIISVILPVYNAENYLAMAINSILNQTFIDFELIIINDGSTDGSKQIIQKIKDGRIKYIENKVNLRLIKTLNLGIDLARGEYIARMDADDIAQPNRFEEQLFAFQSNPSLDIVSSSILLMQDGKNDRSSAMYLPGHTNAIRFICLFETPFAHPNIMVKAEYLRRYRYLDDKSVYHIEDYDLWARMLFEDASVINLNHKLLRYRLNPNGISQGNNELQLNNSLKYSEKLIKLYIKQSADPVILKMIKLRDTNGSIKFIFKSIFFLHRCLVSYKNYYSLKLFDYYEIFYWSCSRIFIMFFKIAKIRLK